METIMKSSILQSVLCLVGINSPLQCLGQQGLNWKNARTVHHELTKGKFISTGEDLDYYTKQISNERHFKNQLDQILIPRPVGSRGHTIVREHLAGTMQGLGWNVTQPSFTTKTPHGNKKFTNVIATLDPSAPRRMVIACHYDSLLKPEGFVGATDSAVPCAQMINLAATMSRELKLLKRATQRGISDLTLQFLFFDGEEAFVKWSKTDSIYGSRNLANSWENQVFSHKNTNGNYNDRIDIFVLLDLIGAGDMAFSKLESSTGKWFDRLAAIEDRLQSRGTLNRGSSMFTNRFPSSRIEDDHKRFKELGVPILHIISTPFPREWHRIGDNKASLDFKRIANLNKILRVFVAEYLHLEDFRQQQ